MKLLFSPLLRFPVLEWRAVASSPDEGIMPANPAAHPQGADTLCFKTWIVVKDKYVKSCIHLTPPHFFFLTLYYFDLLLKLHVNVDAWDE